MKTQVKDRWRCSVLHVLSLVSIYLPILRPDTASMLQTVSSGYCQLTFLRTEIMRSLVADGNFTADHIKQRRPQDDIWLSDGEGMMMAREPYATHIKLAKETKEVGRIYYQFNIY